MLPSVGATLHDERSEGCVVQNNLNRMYHVSRKTALPRLNEKAM
jgi:hypothetical protein